ncbi:MAG: GGDEF domain-containing protein [Spirochaetaceae bacterium]|jgi:diguanylate cyclase (GGDEF)-like protein|nr:GGDEF domain-containing protein [Spirochaetaceae bacterium]
MNADTEDDFLSNPKVLEQYGLLREIGIFRYIDSLNNEIRGYKNILNSASDIFNRTTIDDIMDATVWQISDHFLPSFIFFILKPLQNKETITTKGYKNYKMIDLSLDIESIAPFETFFQEYKKPISYDLLLERMEDKAAVRVMDDLHPELVVPIIGPSGLYSLILIGSKILGDKYNTQELNYLTQLMSFVAQAIQNHLHYEYSVRDVKTGLFNHGFFMSRLNEELARIKRFKKPASLMVLDVDKFKNFNDNYGHLAGDKVLEAIALTLKTCVRTEDIPSRFGGEEFTVLLPDTDKDTAWLVAERLRTQIAEMTISWSPPLPTVTVSIGVVTFNENDRSFPDEIIKRADEALYLSKERGRNRCTVWGTGLLFRLEQTKGRQEKSTGALQTASGDEPKGAAL